MKVPEVDFAGFETCLVSQGAVFMLNRGNSDPNTPLEAALAVLEAGMATIEELRCANNWRQAQRPMLGKLAISKGSLTMAQVFAILGEQAVTGKLFGETAVELGYLKDDLNALLKAQAELTPTLTEALIALGVITSEQASLLSLKSNSATIPTSDPVHVEMAFN